MQRDAGFRSAGVLAACAIVFTLTGCATWMKPGATPSEQRDEMLACLNDAERQFPPNYIRVDHPAYAVAGETRCETVTEGNKTSSTCRQDPTTFYPARTETIDGNRYDRDQPFLSCMRGKGWIYENCVSCGLPLTYYTPLSEHFLYKEDWREKFYK